jgi:hypothetical protein
MSTATAKPQRGAWPELELRTLPDPAEAETLAQRVRVAVCGSDEWDRGPVDIGATCQLGSFKLHHRRLGAATGGLEALLVPCGQRFDLVVDSEPPGGWERVSPELRPELDRHRERFRVAHEWAHSLFYERNPHEGFVRLVADSNGQEEFCDRFAAALLVPPSVAAGMSPAPSSVLDLQRRFDVSLEVALRAVASAHPGTVAWLFVTPERGRPFVQWRSSASYSSYVKTATVMCALNRRRPEERADELEIVWLRARRQALVFANI